jgi:hypothetical protein
MARLSRASRRPLLILCSIALASLLFASPRVAAAVDCATLPNPLYLQVGDTQEPLMKELGHALRDADAPITLVYVTSGSCTNVEALYTGVPITKNPLYVPSTAEDASWTTAKPSVECTIAPSGHPVELANSALFVSSCNPNPPPAGIKLFQGPVQGYGFVVPKQSSQRAITAEEAYFAFGFGDRGMATPWTNESQMFIRTVTKSTLLTLAATVRVPAAQWRGVRFDKSSEVQSALLASPAPEQAIGLLGVELFDRNRDKLTLLAFRALQQRYAYFPDSTATAFDKRNLRDGHYVAWSPTVWLTKVDASGVPSNENARYVIDLILANDVTPKPKFEPIDIAITVGLVPDCAMGVTRSFEAGELSPYQAAEPCGCYFEAKATGKPPSACVACDETKPCATGACRHGYCESR